MNALNRLLMGLLSAALLVGGIIVFIYSLGLFGYDLQSLWEGAQLGAWRDSIVQLVSQLEQGRAAAATVAVLVLVVLVCLVLLVLELRPARPACARLTEDVCLHPRVVDAGAEQVLESDAAVLDSRRGVKLYRRGGVWLRALALVRRGEDLSQVRARLDANLRRSLVESWGVPLRKMSLDCREIDPRRAKVRVK